LTGGRGLGREFAGYCLLPSTSTIVLIGSLALRCFNERVADVRSCRGIFHGGLSLCCTFQKFRS